MNTVRTKRGVRILAWLLAFMICMSMMPMETVSASGLAAGTGAESSDGIAVYPASDEDAIEDEASGWQDGGDLIIGPELVVTARSSLDEDGVSAGQDVPVPALAQDGHLLMAFADPLAASGNIMLAAAKATGQSIPGTNYSRFKYNGLTVAPGDKTSSSYWTYHTVGDKASYAAGSTTITVGEAVRMPVWCDIVQKCSSCKKSFGTSHAVDITDVNVNLSVSGLVSNWYYDVDTGYDSTMGKNCNALVFNFKGAKPGKAQAVMTLYYNTRQPKGTVKCLYCKYSNSVPKDYDWHYSECTLDLTVNVTYKLSYNTQGGTGVPASSKTYAGTSTSFAAAAAPTKTVKITNAAGNVITKTYKFLGWAESAGATAAKYAAGSTVPMTWKSGSTVSKTLYAVWQDPVAYTVIYTDGVSGEEVFADQVHTGLTAGAKTPAYSGDDPVRDGYVFTGWSPEVNPAVGPNEADANGKIVYTAQWVEAKPIIIAARFVGISPDELPAQHVIEYSLDGGGTWTALDSGAAEKSEDGLTWIWRGGNAVDVLVTETLRLRQDGADIGGYVRTSSAEKGFDGVPAVMLDDIAAGRSDETDPGLGGDNFYVVITNVYEENGFKLPDTGGAGAAAFYMAGICLASAGMLMILRKRSGDDE